MFWRPPTASNPLRATLSSGSNDEDAVLPRRTHSAAVGANDYVKAPAPAPAAPAIAARHYTVKRIGVCSGHSSYVTHVDFSRDSTLMRSSDGANEILFWGVPDCAQNPRTISLKDISWATSTVVYGWDLRSIWPAGSDGTDINAVDITRDGDAIITADDKGHVKLFRYPAAGDAQLFKAYLGHSSHVLNARFSPDGHRAFTCGGIDAAVIQWRHCDRAFSAPDQLNWLDSKSIQTHSFTVVVHSGSEGGSFDGIWVELIGSNVRASRHTLSEQSAIKDVLNLSSAATSLPKSASTAFTVPAPVQLAHVKRLGFGFIGKSSSFCDIEKILVRSPSGEEAVFYMRRCLDSYGTDVELLPGDASCAKLTLHCTTGDLLNAGTDGSVRVCLFDEAGNSSGLRRLRTAESRSLFQRKQTDVFDIFCNPPIAAVSSLNVLLEPKVLDFFKCHQHAILCYHLPAFQGIGSDWYLEKFVLSRPKVSSIPGDQDVVYFAAHSWLNTDFPSMKLLGNSADVVFNYTVALTTADCLGAGTDASVSLEFEGEHGKSGFRTLEQSIAGDLNLFERGKKNAFEVKLGRSLGLLKTCRVSMKANGVASLGVDWCLDQIAITDQTSKEEYVFPVYQWLTPSDGVLSVEMSSEVNECVHYSVLRTCFV
jgi:WD40 repeat protein